MNTMPRNARDTFLRFLSDALPGLEIWNIRREFDPSGTVDQAVAQLKTNAVNVRFSKDRFRTKVSGLEANIDCAFEDELKAVDGIAQLVTVLQAAGYLALFDYSGDTPIAVGGTVYWNPNAIDFRPVADQLAYRQTCTLVLSYRNQLVPGLVTPAS